MPDPSPELSTADRIELRDLVERYAHLTDAGAFEAVASLFAPTGVLVAPDPPRDLGPVREVAGAAAIRAELAALTGFALTRHEVHAQVLTEVGADRVRAEVTCTAHHLTAADGESKHRGTDLVWQVRYHDTYARSDRWRFERREITVDVIEVREVRRVNPR